MLRKRLLTTLTVGIMLFGTTSILAESTSSIDTYVGRIEYQDQTITMESAVEMRRQFRLQRASQLVTWAFPMVSFEMMFEVYQAMGNVADGDASTIVTLQGYDPVYPFLTTNVVTPYTLAFINLKLTGPVVVEFPAGAIYGVGNNAWQQPIIELGSGKAVKVLFVGPGQKPSDEFRGKVVQSDTYKMLYFYRVLKTGPEADKLKTGVKAYRLSESANPPATKYVNYDPKPGDPKLRNTPPRNEKFWEIINEYVQLEPLADRDRFFYAWLQDMGMEKGKPFKPTEYQKAILKEGLEVGMAFAQSTAFDSFFPAARYGEDTGWDMVLAGLDTKVDVDTYSMFNQRLSYTYEAVTTAKGMTVYREGKGSAYLGAYYDDNEDALMGARNYSLRLEPNVPVKNFWAITVYDAKNRLIIQNKIRKADISTRTKGLQINKDGSIDLYFGPKSPKGKESNWIQTNPGESFFMYMRFYGPLKAYNEQTWPMNKLKRVK